MVVLDAGGELKKYRERVIALFLLNDIIIVSIGLERSISEKIFIGILNLLLNFLNLVSNFQNLLSNFRNLLWDYRNLLLNSETWFGISRIPP
jgi:hypothetical protein